MNVFSHQANGWLSSAALGPGTIFPIVIVFGAAIIAGAIAAGTGLGAEVRRALGVRRVEVE